MQDSKDSDEITTTTIINLVSKIPGLLANVVAGDISLTTVTFHPISSVTTVLVWDMSAESANSHDNEAVTRLYRTIQISTFHKHQHRAPIRPGTLDSNGPCNRNRDSPSSRDIRTRLVRSGLVVKKSVPLILLQ